MKKCIDKAAIDNILHKLWKKDTGFEYIDIAQIAYNRALQDVQKAIDSKQEKPVSEELGEIILEGANFNKSWYAHPELAFKAGANWQKEQFEKNRLAHCDALTEEQTQMECDFVVQHVKKNNRTPTFIDAIEYGMRLQKQQMMKDAVEVPIVEAVPAGSCKWKLCAKLWLDKGVKGNKVKLIIIKED